jgi:hypothetical protein
VRMPDRSVRWLGRFGTLRRAHKAGASTASAYHEIRHAVDRRYGNVTIQFPISFQTSD